MLLIGWLLFPVVGFGVLVSLHEWRADLVEGPSVECLTFPNKFNK